MSNELYGNDASADLTVQAAMRDLGKAESPVGSNRGAYVDALNQATGSPLGSPWCGNALASWFRAAGRVTPSAPGAAHSWQIAGAPSVDSGAAPISLPAIVIYKNAQGDADHVGLVFRRLVINGARVLIAIEGNTSLGAFDQGTGWIVTLKEVDPSRVLQFVSLS